MQAITVAAAIVTIITGFIAITQYLGGISSETPLVITNVPPEIDILTADKLSPQNAGDIITWTAKATDPEGDLIQYKFLLNGNPVTDWSSQSFWIWSGTKTYIGENQIKVLVRDGNHGSTDSFDDSKVEDFKIIEAIQDSSPPMTSYALTNEYAEDSVEPTCVPGSKQASCSSPDSCVDCKGACWSPGSYDNGNSGKSICSDGKWTIIKNKAYSRTNEYSVDSLEPTCIPESKQASCSSPDSCVDCKGACWSPGSYDNGNSGKSICSDGKWTIIKNKAYSRTNEYSVDSLEPTCIPESKQASCSSPDSCVDCNGACWPSGSYDNGNNGKSICSDGKWTIIKDKAYSRTNEYTVDSVEPTCIPGSKETNCSSPDSCVDCSGRCWSPGSYDNGKKICFLGKWTIS